MKAGGDFWSRRKAAVEAEHAAQIEVAQDDARAAQAAEKTDTELLAELDLPDPDALKMGDDFSGFMAKAVPERLRRRALRTLWRSNPVLANLDDLVDYNEDFNATARDIGDIKTSYQVGKGMLAHLKSITRDDTSSHGEASHGETLIEGETLAEGEMLARTGDAETGIAAAETAATHPPVSQSAATQTAMDEGRLKDSLMQDGTLNAKTLQGGAARLEPPEVIALAETGEIPDMQEADLVQPPSETGTAPRRMRFAFETETT